MLIISKSSQTLFDKTWSIWTTQPTQLVHVCEIGEGSVRAFSGESGIIFLWADFGHSPIFQEK